MGSFENHSQANALTSINQIIELRKEKYGSILLSVYWDQNEKRISNTTHMTYM